MSFIKSGKFSALIFFRKCSFFLFKRFLFIYSLEITQREAETQAEGEAGSMQGARPCCLPTPAACHVPRPFISSSSGAGLAFLYHSLNSHYRRCLGGLAVECLPSVQGGIPGFQDQVLHWAPCMEPASPSACVSASLCVSLMNT